MKFIKLATLTFIVCLLAGTLSSCRHEGEYDYSNITITCFCTEDLLDFYAPKLLIDNGNGRQQEIVLQKGDFKHYGNSSDNPYSGQGTETENAVMYCKVTERLENLQGNFKATLVYDQMGDERIDDTKKYLLSGGISRYTIEAFCQDGHIIKILNCYINQIGLSDWKNVTDEQLHIFAHQTFDIDLKYNINTIDDDDIVFDGDCTVTVGSR